MIDVEILCSDGFIIKGSIFTPNQGAELGKLVVINSATGVSKDFYANYATFLSTMGFLALTYDYRGVAASRPLRLKGFDASFTSWGQLDFEAVLNFANANYPNYKILVFGHSIGGTLIGFASNYELISGIVNIGAQTAYYKDWEKEGLKRYALWHILFPVITSIFGYFPGKTFNLLEDLPKGVIRQWNARKRTPDFIDQLNQNNIKSYYKDYKKQLLTLLIADDVIGTEKAIARVHNLFINAKKSLLLIKPADLDVAKIGHFGFFSRKFKTSLWQQSIGWFMDLV